MVVLTVNLPVIYILYVYIEEVKHTVLPIICMDTGINIEDNRLLFNSVESFKEWGNVCETNGVSITIMYLNCISISKHWTILLLQLRGFVVSYCGVA